LRLSFLPPILKQLIQPFESSSIFFNSALLDEPDVEIYQALR